MYPHDRPGKPWTGKKANRILIGAAKKRMYFEMLTGEFPDLNLLIWCKWLLDRGCWKRAAAAAADNCSDSNERIAHYFDERCVPVYDSNAVHYTEPDRNSDMIDWFSFCRQWPRLNGEMDAYFSRML